MAPFHTPRHEARALPARALAAVALFAAALLAGGAARPLASAEADKGGQGAANGIGNGNGPGDHGGGPKHEVPGNPPSQAPVPPPGAPEPAPVESQPVAAPVDTGNPGNGNGNAGTTGNGNGNGNSAARTGGYGNAAAKTGGNGNGAANKTTARVAAPTQPAAAATQPAAPSASQATAPPAATSEPAQPGEPGGQAGEPGGQAGEPGGQAGEPNTNRSGDRNRRSKRSGATGDRTTRVARTDSADTGGEAATEPAPARSAAAGTFDRVGEGAEGDDGSAKPKQRDAGGGAAADEEEAPPIVRPLTEIVKVVPDSVKAALAALAALSVLLGLGYLLSTLRARALDRHRRELLQEVGLLQTALLPPVPERLGSLRTSVSYRPADGPGAGGDFYDVLPLPGGRVGFILGDVSGHGRGALARTAFMRYTLRAYLEAGLEPRVALQVAGRVIDENLGGDFATVLLAVHDPETGSLTYATAGHPAPIVVGPQPHDPVTAGSSPPIGVGVRTGLRQTTVPLVPGSVACLFTDGLMEARVDGGVLGRGRLEELLEALGAEATAHGLIERVSGEARVLSDDIAAVVVSPTAGVTAGLFRTEQLELTARELEGPMAPRFLESCGVPAVEVDSALYDARTLAERFGGVVLHVVFGNRLRVEVLPRNVESIEAASRRAATY